MEFVPLKHCLMCFPKCLLIFTHRALFMWDSLSASLNVSSVYTSGRRKGSEIPPDGLVSGMSRWLFWVGFFLVPLGDAMLPEHDVLPLTPRPLQFWSQLSPPSLEGTGRRCGHPYPNAGICHSANVLPGPHLVLAPTLPGLGHPLGALRSQQAFPISIRNHSLLLCYNHSCLFLFIVCDLRSSQHDGECLENIFLVNFMALAWEEEIKLCVHLAIVTDGSSANNLESRTNPPRSMLCHVARLISLLEFYILHP